MTINIDNLTFNAIIGILPFERETPQKVIVDVELDYEFKNNNFIDYSNLAKLIEDNIKNSKYKLVENALLNLHVEIKNRFPQASSIKLKIHKPTILPYCDVSVSSTRKY